VAVMTAMKKHSFDRIREIVYETSGISLSVRKEALVSARVGKRMRALGITSYEEYLEFLEDNNPEELVGLLDAVSTNVTSFFRESHHFEFIADEVAGWYEQGQRRFRFWSAACSTGEEPLSLAMVLREALPYPDVNLRILATDICTETLQTCELATYPERKVTPIPLDLRSRWFTARGKGAERLWTAKPVLTDSIVYRRMNLSTPPFPMKGPMDAVFCRNVMIYFDDPVRIRLLEEIGRLLKPGGLLIVGHAESLAGILSNFKYVRPSVYRKL
jgi:chemotaxis protein methyltransferase CheR